MKIGYVVTHFPPLTETFIRREVLALCDAGEEVFVYAETVVSDPLAAPPAHPRLKVRRTAFGASLARVAKADGVEHLHGTLMLRAQQAACDTAGTLGIPFSITAYSGYSVFTTSDASYRRMSESPFCAGIVVEDEFMRDWMVEHHGIDAKQLKLIANSLDLDAYPAVGHGPRTRPRILAISRFVPKKGLHLLIEAFGRLRERREAELHLIGSGPEESALRRAAAGIADIHFLGMQPEARCREAYASADILAAPCVRGPDGDADGIPTVVLEAMACGLPVVVSDLLSAPCYVRDGVAGALVAPGDVAALAQRLEELCDDDALRERLGRNGRRRVEERCDVRRNVETLRALFIGKGKPLVSVCITAYNRAHLVGDAIDSVLRQTYRPIEIIVADDGSTDGTAQVLARYEGKIRVVRHETNRGCPAAKNLALRARGVDADPIPRHPERGRPLVPDRHRGAARTGVRPGAVRAPATRREHLAPAERRLGRRPLLSRHATRGEEDERGGGASGRGVLREPFAAACIRECQDRISVLAIAHERRKPDYRDE